MEGLENAKEDLDKIYAETKAKSETEAVSLIMQDPKLATKTKLSEKLVNAIDTSEYVDKKVNETANIIIDKGLEAQQNEAKADVIGSEDSILDADFKKNKAEYLFHGIDHKIDKEWKRKMVHCINDIWFVIWAIVGFFTIVPVSTFLSRIKALSGIVKWIAICIGVGLLLTILASITYGCLKHFGVI